MSCKVTRTKYGQRMTDMYIIRFGGHPNRNISFTARAWKKVFPKLLPGQTTEMLFDVRET